MSDSDWSPLEIVMIVSVLVEGLGLESNLDSFDLDPTFKVRRDSGREEIKVMATL